MNSFQSGPANSAQPQQIRVLLVEDDEDDFVLIRRLLSHQDGRLYELDWVQTTENALQSIMEHPYEIILVDYYLGATDGLDLVSSMHQHGFTTPVILLTGMENYEIDLEAMQAGAFDYLVKSELTSDQLERSIRYAVHRKRIEILSAYRLEFTRALNRIDRTILSTHDLFTTLNVALSISQTFLKIDAAVVMLLSQDGQTLEYAAGVGFRTQAVEKTCLSLQDSLPGRAAMQNRTIAVHHYSPDEEPFRQDLIQLEGFHDYWGVPLIAKGKIKGVLEVFHRSENETGPEWQDFLVTLGGQVAIAVENAHLIEDLQRSKDNLSLAYDTTLEGWSQALDLRDHETEGHTRRVAQITLQLAREFDIDPRDLVHIRRGALLHDIGKMGIPDAILHKPGPLTDEEWVIMREHPVYAQRILSRIQFLTPALDIPYLHHERWDGSGYPNGLVAEDIPLAARIFAVVDVWDALRSDRPYRSAWPREKVIDYMKEEAGKSFDPQVVSVFLRMSQEGYFN